MSHTNGRHVSCTVHCQGGMLRGGWAVCQGDPLAGYQGAL